MRRWKKFSRVLIRTCACSMSSNTCQDSVADFRGSIEIFPSRRRRRRKSLNLLWHNGRNKTQKINGSRCYSNGINYKAWHNVCCVCGSELKEAFCAPFSQAHRKWRKIGFLGKSESENYAVRVGRRNLDKRRCHMAKENFFIGRRMMSLRYRNRPIAQKFFFCFLRLDFVFKSPNNLCDIFRFFLTHSGIRLNLFYLQQRQFCFFFQFFFNSFENKQKPTNLEWQLWVKREALKKWIRRRRFATFCDRRNDILSFFSLLVGLILVFLISQTTLMENWKRMPSVEWKLKVSCYDVYGGAWWWRMKQNIKFQFGNKKLRVCV